jgi:tetratricopeptide (TPR) repeat protein
MTTKVTLLILLTFLFGNLQAQTIEELYDKRDFNEIVKYADKSDELSEFELYCVGYAFFQLENDKKAIEMYDKAIEKGMDDDGIYLYRGLSLRYDKQYDKAIEAFRMAVDRNPQGQKNYTELGNSFYFQKEYDSALVYFYKARELKFELGDPYLKIPNIYDVQNNFDKALEEYYISASLIDKRDRDYVEILKEIGRIEYVHKKNYDKSIEAYSEVMSIVADPSLLSTKLIKAYYAQEDFARGDSVFNIIKTKYEKNELPKKMMEVRGEVVDEFTWKGQRVRVMKYYKTPTEFAEPIYQFFLVNLAGTKIEKKILTEKTSAEIDGTKHLLCGLDKATGTHYTYPIGWKSDEIDYKKLKEYVILIFDGEIEPQASSSFSGGESSKESKKKKKRKKNK